MKPLCKTLFPSRPNPVQSQQNNVRTTSSVFEQVYAGCVTTFKSTVLKSIRRGYFCA